MFVEAAAAKAYKPASLLNYNRVFYKLRKFLDTFSVPFVLPIPHYFIYLFVGHLISKNTPSSTIRSSVSAISWLHRIHNFPDPTFQLLMKKVLIGSSKLQPAPLKLLPIDRNLLHLLCYLSYLHIPSQYNQKLFRAVICLMYYACLRVGEAAKSASTEHTIKFSNVECLDTPPRSVSILLHSFKHSKSPKKLILHAASDQPVCPIIALQEYLEVRTDGCDTLFNDITGKTATCLFIVDTLKMLLGLGFQPIQYSFI